MRVRVSPTPERATVALLLGAMLGVVLWRSLPFLGPVPPEGLYSSDSAVPVLMCNLATFAPLDWLYWGQDRFGSWPFLLARAAGAVVDGTWTPHRLHVFRTLFLAAALVPWLALAGRAGLVAAAGLLLLPATNPLLQRVLLDLATVDGWQVPALLWAWWGIRNAAAGHRRRLWLALASVAAALATWTSLVSAPLLLVLAAVEARGGGLRRAALALPALVGFGVELGVRTSWHHAIRARGWRDVRTQAALDVGHLLENARQIALAAWHVEAVPWLLLALAGAVVALSTRRWRGLPEARTVVGAAAASLTALLIVVSVRHVRGNEYNPRYLGVGLCFAVLGTWALAGLVVRAAVARLRPDAAPVVLGAGGLGMVLLLAPVAGPDAREVALRPAAAEIAVHHRGAVLALGYWRTYALAGLLPAGAVIPVPREGEWNRRPDWASELRSGRPVLIGTPDRPGEAPPPTLLERGAPLSLVRSAVILLPPFPGESTGEEVSLYRLTPDGR